MILKYVICVIFILKSLYVLTSGQPKLHFFRSDYKYLDATRSFYKIHKAKTWRDAKVKCDLEGAKLFYPKNINERDVVISYINKINRNIDSIYIGINAVTKGVFQSVDGVPIKDVYNQWMSGEPNDITAEDDCIVMNKIGLYKDDKCNRRLPYLCKKTMESFTQWNNECNVPFLEYKFNKELNKCYKFHTLPKSWVDAAQTCEAEQAYLAIPNSQEEASYLSKITNENPKNYSGSYLSGAVHLGYRFDETLDDWITVKGDTLEQAGYFVWNYYKPDGGEQEHCGGMFYNGQLNDISCEAQHCYFICERDNDNLNAIL
ncbi:PREDICTED: macrophage mannose receptor 1-like [Papilio polytes]|uniref:macrophage mannose receptor 1-like n=1 Tax=Papilio polytes TaxID=76194 RepID=UPI0006764ABD|nr:PREDICTED: macrophage mannose receptor 1-like [Papilio polytes]